MRERINTRKARVRLHGAEAAQDQTTLGGGWGGLGGGDGTLFGTCILIDPVITQLHDPCLSFLGLPAGVGAGQKRGTWQEGRKREVRQGYGGSQDPPPLFSSIELTVHTSRSQGSPGSAPKGLISTLQ